MLRFLPLINSLVTIGLSFLLIISAIKSSKTFNNLLSFMDCILQHLYKHLAYHSSFRLKLLYHHSDLSLLFSRSLIKNWYFTWYESFAYRYILWISGWWFVKLSKEFVFLDPEPELLIFCIRWSGIYDRFGLFAILFSFVTLSKLSILYLDVLSALFSILL